MRKMVTYFWMAIFLFAGWRTAAGQTTVTYQLTMWTTGQHQMWDGNNIRYYGFSDGFLTIPYFPAPILYANEGDSVLVNVRNQSQGAPHTIHWHGLDVDQANDGVPNLSFSIHHQEDTSYKFLAPHPGTYLYHCHVASVVHVQMGMYGNVVIRPADGSNRAWTGGPEFDKESLWLLSEFDKSWHDTIPTHNTGDSLHPRFSIPPYIPDYFMVNGLSRQQLTDSTAIQAKVGEKVYLRLANVGFFMNEIVFPNFLDATIISSDGRALPNALRRDTLRITPGERYGVMLTPSQEIDSTVSISYQNMNTRDVWNTEYVPVNISGFIGIEESRVFEGKLSLYPTPSEGVINLFWDQMRGDEFRLKLYDLTGSMAAKKELKGSKSGSIVWDLSALPAGIYHLSFESENGRISKKFALIH